MWRYMSMKSDILNWDHSTEPIGKVISTTNYRDGITFKIKVDEEAIYRYKVSEIINSHPRGSAKSLFKRLKEAGLVD